MTIVAANVAKQSFGKMLDAAQTEPVLIQKHNRPAAVILSAKDYERLRGINTAEYLAFCESIGLRAESHGLTENGLAKILSDS